ncbi:unnamed protein product [Calypogeia fissa]
MSAPAPAAPGGGGGGASSLLKPSRALVTIISVGFILQQIFRWPVDYLALVPGKTIPFTWNLITAGYFEHTVVGLTASLSGLLFFGRLFEPVWGSREFFKFILVVNLFSSVCTFIVAIVLYYLIGDENLLYTPIAGLHGVLAGFCVAVKQIFPDYDILASTIKVGKLRAKWLPAVSIMIAILLGIFMEYPIVYVPFILFGTYGSWIYLRYFQRRSESTVAGDPSGEFAFQTFFPEILWPVVNPVATWFDKLCCGKRGQVLGGNEGDDLLLGGNPLPGSDSAEAARRRERGARALEERLIVSSNTKPKEEV